ncbi:hypothetical protein CIL06_21415 [Pantoea vagans]|nr:hypothetical protein CIL06_21415 [Pantoea vagans]
MRCDAVIPQSRRFTVRAVPNWHGPVEESLWALSTPSRTRFSQRGCDIPTALSASCVPYSSGDLPPDAVRKSNTVIPRLPGMTYLPFTSEPACGSFFRLRGGRDFCGLV